MAFFLKKTGLRFLSSKILVLFLKLLSLELNSSEFQKLRHEGEPLNGNLLIISPESDGIHLITPQYRDQVRERVDRRDVGVEGDRSFLRADLGDEVNDFVVQAGDVVGVGCHRVDLVNGCLAEQAEVPDWRPGSDIDSENQAFLNLSSVESSIQNRA